MFRLLVLAAAFAASTLSVRADAYSYTCKMPGDTFIVVHIDDAANTLAWHGSKLYHLKPQPACAKDGWRATAKEGESFNFCTATQGGGGIEMDGGTVIQCQMDP